MSMAVPAGRLMSYMYISPTDEECVNGEDWWYDANVTAGVWHTMFMYIKLNTPGAPPTSIRCAIIFTLYCFHAVSFSCCSVCILYRFYPGIALLVAFPA